MSSGIYIIQSIRYPGRQYVGSAIDFQLREMVHQSALIAKTHFNAKLQNHFNKYGLNDFLFLRLEYCSRESLLIREQYFIDRLDPFFNICQIAGSRQGCKHKPATILKMRSAAKKRFKQSRRAQLHGRLYKN